MKIFINLAGNTLGSHEKFVKKLTTRGAKEVKTPEESDRQILFCPIVSRFEADVEWGLSQVNDGCTNLILVAMHHTFDKHYALPKTRAQSYPKVSLMVDCLFFENKGLLKCPCNEAAVEAVRKELGLKRFNHFTFNKTKGGGGKTEQNESNLRRRENKET